MCMCRLGVSWSVLWSSLRRHPCHTCVCSRCSFSPPHVRARCVPHCPLAGWACNTTLCPLLSPGGSPPHSSPCPLPSATLNALDFNSGSSASRASGCCCSYANRMRGLSIWTRTTTLKRTTCGPRER